MVRNLHYNFISNTSSIFSDPCPVAPVCHGKSSPARLRHSPKPGMFPLALFLFFLVSEIYSTVTDLAKFLGKSTFKPSATASQ